LAVLVAELSADIGSGAVGRLETRDSHLLEKSSQFVPIHRLAADALPNGARHEKRASAVASLDPGMNLGETYSRVPTRLLSPLEFNAPLKEKELVVLERRAFVIEAIRFEERLEAVEWWAPSPVSRDYFRLWLAVASSTTASSTTASSTTASSTTASNTTASNTTASNTTASNTTAAHASSPRLSPRLLAAGSSARDGVEVLVYLNRDDGKKFVQALYD
jgi:hypothetical protein